MEKVDVVVKSPTGSISYRGKLCIQSGIIEYHVPGKPIEYSHISSEIGAGYEVFGLEPLTEPSGIAVSEPTETPAPSVEEKKPEIPTPAPSHKKKSHRK